TYSGHASLSPDGMSVVFGRYWNQGTDGMINHQLWLAPIEGDGADAIPIGPVHRSLGGHNPFYQTFAPDGSAIIVHTTDDQQTYIADPTDGSVEEVEWGVVHDPPSWQRRAPGG
ncbi:MAG: hypothetical protein M3Y29_06995, partial [Chloroflexota bacterium]|nr:hypothetical protein [Chloroflexota bacterium]